MAGAAQALIAGDDAALALLAEAGKAGVALGRELALSAAIRLENAGLARVRQGVHFRAFVTRAGAAHHRRTSR